jgi:hypothetical protein
MGAVNGWKEQSSTVCPSVPFESFVFILIIPSVRACPSMRVRSYKCLFYLLNGSLIKTENAAMAAAAADTRESKNKTSELGWGRKRDWEKRK